MAAELEAAAVQPRSRWRLIAGAAGAVILIIALAVWHYSGRESTDDAQIDTHITTIAARVGGAVASVPVRDTLTPKR